MHTHANARLTQKGRLRLVSQYLNDHRPLAELAAETGISSRCAYKWLARYRSGGAAALVDRRSIRRTQRLTLDPQRLQRAVNCDISGYTCVISPGCSRLRSPPWPEC